MFSGLEYSSKGLQSVCPTGISTFDNLIGGGFALTSVNILDGDEYQIYSSMLLKAYISSAIYANQNVILFSPTILNKKSRFIKELPSLRILEQEQKEINDNATEDTMKIAFRYSNLPSRFNESHKIDYGNYIDSSRIEKAHIEFYDHSDIIKVLRDKINNAKDCNKVVSRILIDSLGSPLGLIKPEELVKIVYQIKILIRRLPQFVCLINLIPQSKDYDILDLYGNPVRQRLYFQVDSALQCLTFEESDNNPYSRDYVGILKFFSLPRLNSFGPYNPMLNDTQFGIKIHQSKRFLTIEKLSLPPDLSETVNRFTNTNQITKSIEF